LFATVVEVPVLLSLVYVALWLRHKINWPEEKIQVQGQDNSDAAAAAAGNATDDENDDDNNITTKPTEAEVEITLM
jgi:hypothetical protein